jgi:hypothetical protein
MGCDIHTQVEIKKLKNGEEVWVTADYYTLNDYYRGKNYSKVKYDASKPINDYPETDHNYYENEPKYTVAPIYNNRNYTLFAILANVRNYGASTYIDDPRGIPPDACKETIKNYEYWGIDAHSASYFTLKELMDWQKTAPKFKESGMISEEQAKALDQGILPTSWCQGTTNPNYVHREWEVESTDLQHLIDKLIKRGTELYMWYLDDQIEERADSMRIIFWFDN